MKKAQSGIYTYLLVIHKALNNELHLFNQKRNTVINVVKMLFEW